MKLWLLVSYIIASMTTGGADSDPESSEEDHHLGVGDQRYRERCLRQHPKAARGRTSPNANAARLPANAG
ncbi:MAG TPA: hypothetical protein VJR06_03655, partial [Nitrososphaerales archaeon]|nr:hypothetical protein [Nitrososphaerales archaeon]